MIPDGCRPPRNILPIRPDPFGPYDLGPASLRALLLILIALSCRPASAAFDRYGGDTSVALPATGWFHLGRIAGRPYLITPEGHPFFSLGVTHAVDCIRRDELNVFPAKYHGDETQLAGFLLRNLRDWGYNTSGYGTLPAMTDRIPYIATIQVEGPRSHAAHSDTSFADVYDPVVRERIRTAIRRNTAPHRDNPFCIGYLFCDLPVWHNRLPNAPAKSTYPEFMRALGADAAGKQAYVAFLRERYRGDLAACNRRYQLAAASFAALLDSDFAALNLDDAGVMADDEAFVNEIADTYYGLLKTTLASEDANHLFLGDTFMALPERTYTSVIRTAAKYVDVVCFQPMGTRQMLGRYVAEIHALTDRPVLFTDVNCILTRPAKDQADTTEYERAAGELTRQFYLDAAAAAGCIGLHRCTFRDYYVYLPTYYRRGLLKADDSPYPLLVDYSRRINQEVLDLVYGLARTALIPAAEAR